MPQVIDDDAENLELEPPDAERHRRRVRMNRKHRKRDRWRRKLWRLSHWQWRRRDPTEKDYNFKRRQTAPETGYGVAYERNPDAGSY